MKPFTKTASIILAIVALLHLARVLLQNAVMVDDVSIPMWVSIVGFIVATILSIGLWSESN